MIVALTVRSLIASLGLLACATSASAECAWILWAEAGTGAPSVDSAYPSLAACDQALADTRDTMKDTGYTVAKRILPGYHVLTGQKGPVRLVYHCPPTPRTRVGQREVSGGYDDPTS